MPRFGFVTCVAVWNGVMVSEKFDASIFKNYFSKCNYKSITANGVKSLKAMYIFNTLSSSDWTQTEILALRRLAII
jgi:hypothetical protein